MEPVGCCTTDNFGSREPLVPWTEINPSLMATTVFGNANGFQPHSCPHCLLSDHGREECALAPLEDPKATAAPPVVGRPSHAVHHPAPYKPPDNNYCQRFNQGIAKALTVTMNTPVQRATRLDTPRFTAGTVVCKGVLATLTDYHQRELSQSGKN